MGVSLGIDTGGTYTDAVLVDREGRRMLASAKALTTHHNLSVGIREAMESVLARKRMLSPEQAIEMVALSTTLATNAIAEERGSRVCLVLIGYDPEVIRQYDFREELVTDDVLYVGGGHDLEGNEEAPLDEAAVRHGVLSREKTVEAFGVSGYFGTRNPAHELRVKAIVEELTGLPVSCGHELTTRLNSIRRATTVALNAGLIPLLRDLILGVQKTMADLAVDAPLLVVKGDGSLVRAEWAVKRPIDTILSGPAASVMGARHLTGQRDIWVVDMGGTTTDIAILRDGQVRLNTEGARVGRRKTLVEAVDVRTVGLGGDSHIRLGREKEIRIGPRRVVPLSLLAAQHPEVMETLRRQVSAGADSPGAGQFAVSGRDSSCRFPEEDRVFLAEIGKAPLPLISRDRREDWLFFRRIEYLEKRCRIQRAAFTPTDALHVLGRLRCWNREAAEMGARLLAPRLDLTPGAFCEAVVRRVSDQVATAFIDKILEDRVGPPDHGRKDFLEYLLGLSMGRDSGDELACSLTLRLPLAAVGAPVEAFMHRVAGNLHTGLFIPAHAEVANAVGAVAGSVIQRRRVLITPQEGASRFRVHLPDGVQDFLSLEEAVSRAGEIMIPYMENTVRKAGGGRVTVQADREDRWVQEIFLDTELLYTAIARPEIAPHGSMALRLDTDGHG